MKRAVYVTSRMPQTKRGKKNRPPKPPTCSHWSGCSEPPAEGRPYCRMHAQRTDELGAYLAQGERERSKARAVRLSLEEDDRG